MALCTALPTRSGRLQVETEQLAGMARDADHAVLAHVHVQPPERAGVGRRVPVDGVHHAQHRRRARGRLGQVEAERQAVGIVAQVDLDLVVGDRDGDRQRHAVGHPLEGVVARVHRDPPVGQAPDRLGHPTFAVVEPRRHERVETIPAHLTRELRHLPLADASRAQQREVVALPLDRDADTHLAHADDVVDVLVVALHLDARQDDRALLVDIPRHRGVRRRLGVPDVRQVGLAEQREAMLALVVEHRHEDAHVRRVGVAVVGRVVHEGIALAELRVKLLHALRHQVGAAEHVHGDALGEAEELVVGGDDAAREVAAGVEDHRAPGADQRVGHGPHDRGEAARKHRQVDRIERLGRRLKFAHNSPWKRPCGADRCSEIESTGVSVWSVTTSTSAGPRSKRPRAAPARAPQAWSPARRALRIPWPPARSPHR